jgi:hypothetical protein
MKISFDNSHPAIEFEKWLSRQGISCDGDGQRGIWYFPADGAEKVEKWLTEHGFSKE